MAIESTYSIIMSSKGGRAETGRSLGLLKASLAKETKVPDLGRDLNHSLTSKEYVENNGEQGGEDGRELVSGGGGRTDSS